MIEFFCGRNNIESSERGAVRPSWKDITSPFCCIYRLFRFFVDGFFSLSRGLERKRISSRQLSDRCFSSLDTEKKRKRKGGREVCLHNVVRSYT